VRRGYGSKAPDRHALEEAGVGLPAVLAATVTLARRGSGKWHVVVPERNLEPAVGVHVRPEQRGKGPAASEDFKSSETVVTL
jgi:hypothetical protein